VSCVVVQSVCTDFFETLAHDVGLLVTENCAVHLCIDHIVCCYFCVAGVCFCQFSVTPSLMSSRWSVHYESERLDISSVLLSCPVLLPVA